MLLLNPLIDCIYELIESLENRKLAPLVVEIDFTQNMLRKNGFSKNLFLRSHA